MKSDRVKNCIADALDPKFDVLPAVFGANGEKDMNLQKLKELEELARQLLASAYKLPPGPDRQNALRELDGFRARISALQGPDIVPADRTPKTRAK